MTTTVPLKFKLPDGWQPADPTKVGLPETTFVALHPGSANGFTANLTIAEQERTDGAPLAQLADESVGRLNTLAANVTIEQRAEVGSPEVPGFTQILRLSTESLEVIQCQMLVSFVDEEDPDRQVVVEIAPTATPAQLPPLIKDFQQSAATVRPDLPAA